MVQRMKWYTLANDKVTKEERASFKWADVQCNSVVSSSIVRSESSCMENGFAYLSFSFIMMSALFALLPVWAIECVCVCCTVRYAYLLILLVSFSFAHFIYFVFLVGFFCFGSVSCSFCRIRFSFPFIEPAHHSFPHIHTSHSLPRSQPYLVCQNPVSLRRQIIW